MRKRACFLIILFVGVFTFVSFASGATIRKVIDINVHHLGDNSIAWMRHPAPDGVVWQKTFTLPAFSSSTATIVLSVADVDAADLLINGNRIAIPITSGGEFTRTYREHAVTFPASFLKPSAINTIRIEALEATEGSVGNRDDFEIIKVVLFIH
ncbi:MAG: hypothetical protein AB9866_20670 [Syntrophobacteraceae bacterium]